ncbi:Beta-galactosidase 7, partial [Cucurbita argyrosperma subsp. sororia]
MSATAAAATCDVWLMILALALFSSAEKLSVSYDGRALTINGQRKIIISGSIHYPRSTPEIENEYGNIKGSYGQAGNEYVKWCADLALSYNLSIPWIMCQEDDAPQPISMEEVLTYGEVNHTEYGHLTTATSYTYKGKSSCFFGNAENGDRDITYGNRTYKVRGWSVSILPDCKTEVYNTAEVNTQTTIWEKVSSQVGNFKEPMQWQWRDEKIEFVSREGEVADTAMTANRLLDQKVLTNDSSDYLWYITSFHLSGSDPLFGKNVTLRIKTSGHILHAFLNGRHIGSQHAQKDKYSFVFEKKISDLLYGFNQISLLSATVGLANYGAHFENSEVGVHGPVELIADGETIRNLSSNEWYYKVGLDGEKSEFFNPNCQLMEPWNYGNLPLNQNFVWYKTTFQTPSGSEAVIVDLMGMGKGHAWVNGLSIGRYWPSYLSTENGCSSSCDFRGAYSDGKCATNCGKPTQRWYHIPRSYLNCEGENTLILFEEFGGTPLDIDIQTTRVKKVCAMPYAGSTLELSCHDRTISDIKFVSFGNPHGTCDSFQKGSCESSTALSVIEEACVGQRECSIEVSEKNLGSTGCKKRNRLAVQVTC